MTLEEMKKELRAVQEKQQNAFMEDLLDRVNNLCEKANKKDYEPTKEEKEMFGYIVTIIDNMKEWF